MSRDRRNKATRTAFGLALLMCLAALAVSAGALAQEQADDIYRLTRMVVFGSAQQGRQALIRLGRDGRQDVVPALILARRYSGIGPEIDRTLSTLTGNRSAAGWEDWMVWLQRRDDVAAEESYLRLKLDVLARIDRRFNRFFNRPDLAHEIRLEEIAWRGLHVDDVRALTDPAMIPARSADYLDPDDLVFGIEIDGDARAYPLRILDWHEVVNDVIGEVPVMLAHCPLCGTAVLYDTAVDGLDTPLEFGNSGLVYRATQLVYDRRTDSLWDLFAGRPVVGPLAGSGIELATLPMVTTRWAEWRQRHPGTLVLSPDTGFAHPYIPGAANGGLMRDPEPPFPVATDDYRMAPKDLVYGVRLPEGSKAWPVASFAEQRVINDRLGGAEIVLIGDADSQTVRAYRREGHEFTATGSPRVLNGTNASIWRVAEEALLGPDGARLARVPGLTAYWFAWSDRQGGAAELYAPDSVPTD